jgi:transposase
VPLRRLAAVQLVANKAARVADVAAAFGVDTGTLWRWGQQLSATGVGGLVPDKRGPKGAHRLTPEMVADIIARRAAGASYRAIAAAVGVSYTSVRRVSASKMGGEWAGEACRRSAAEPGWVVAVRSSAWVGQAAGSRVTL